MKAKLFQKLNIIRSLKLLKVQRRIIFVLSFVVFVIINSMLAPLAFRLDLSSGKAYTLSPSTKKLVSTLDEVVTLRFFASSELPSRLIPLKSEVNDLLSEYKRAGGSKINVKQLDPKKDTKAAEEASKYGVPELQFSQIERDKYAVTASQFGIVLSYGDKQEVIPQVTDIDSLEYNLSAAIYKMTRKELPKIGLMGYPAEMAFNPQEDQLRSIRTVLGQQFTVEAVDVSTASAVTKLDPSFKALIVLDNTTKQYDSQEIAAIKDFIRNKGSVLAFVDGVWIADRLTTTPPQHGLVPLLKDYGITINNDLLLSTTAELVNFGNQSVQFMVPYPFWLKTNNFNEKLSYFSNVSQLTFPWVSSISINKKSGMEVDEIIKTTKQSWQQKEPFTLNPQTIPEPKESDLKEFTIGALARVHGQGQIIVLPSSRFILERFLSRNSGNIALTVNILNDVASGGALSGITQRAVKFYPIPDIPESQKDLFKYLNALFLPLTISLYGAFRLLRRR